MQSFYVLLKIMAYSVSQLIATMRRVMASESGSWPSKGWWICFKAFWEGSFWDYRWVAIDLSFALFSPIDFSISHISLFSLQRWSLFANRLTPPATNIQRFCFTANACECFGAVFIQFREIYTCTNVWQAMRRFCELRSADETCSLLLNPASVKQHSVVLLCLLLERWTSHTLPHLNDILQNLSFSSRKDFSMIFFFYISWIGNYFFFVFNSFCSPGHT